MNQNQSRCIGGPRGAKKSGNAQRRLSKCAKAPCRPESLEPRAYLSITVGSAEDFPDLTSPNGMVVADLNADGVPDVALAGINPNTNLPTVAVYLGGATPPIYYDLPASQRAFDLVSADFNGDSVPDLAVTDPVNATVSVMLNNGDGTFAAPIITNYGTAQPAGSSTTAYLATADFNGDTKADLVVTDPADQKIVELLGNGNGTFTPGTPLTLAEPAFDPLHIVAAAFGNGQTDIAFNDGTSPQVYLSLGDGAGNFAAPTPTAVAGAIQGMAAGDLNADSVSDLTVSTSSGGTSGTDTVDVLIASAGAFAAASPLTTTFQNPGPIAIGDINGDGVADIVTMNSTGLLDLFQGEGNGIFTSVAAQSDVTNGTPQALATNDVTGDGKADVLFSEVNAAISNDGGFGLVQGAGAPVFSESLSGATPSSGVVGQKIKLSQTLKLTNISGATVSGTNDIDLALSTDQTMSPDDFIITTFSKSFGIRNGKSHSLRLIAPSLPSSLAPGTYYVIVQVVDSGGGIVSATSAGTINVAAAEVDLTGAFKKSPKSARLGNALAGTITITNNGNVVAIETLPIIVDTSMADQLDDTAVPALTKNIKINIKPEKSLTLNLVRILAPTSVGTYFLIVQLDPMDTLSDVSLASNTFVSAAIPIS